MTAIPSPSLRAYVTAGIVGLAAALAVGDPTPALIGVALLVLAVIGLAGGAAPGVKLTAHDIPTSTVEGEEVEFTVRISVGQPIGRTYVDLGLAGLEITDVTGARAVGVSTVSLAGIREVAEIAVTAVATTWGRAAVGPISLYTDSPLGMFDLRLETPERHSMLALPAEATLRTLLSPLETNLHVGDLVSRHRGSGSEFADLRQFRHGDDPRSVNWRVSSRSDELWVNERHPERNGDVLLLVDAQIETGTELVTLVDRSVRMAAALLHAHSRRRHRLGLITLDGLCRWVYPGMGELHRRRLLEQLMGVTPGEVIWEAAERAVIRAARRPSMVIALTTLMDPSLAGLMHTLRRSGIDVSVVALDVDPALPPATGQARSLGRRIWSMERDRLRDRLAGEGIPVVVWRTIDPADVPLARLDEMRTSWRRLA
ncbi:MAG TPA: DUF58 domain-containing protein [Acidimicrobiia bacterium]|nr:DUF58 domain-containing protein [Acidimicrobiia bacterium]